MSERPPVVLRWGGGVNSTAMAVGLYERGERPDFVVFSDTGGEKPETYTYMVPFSAWLSRVGFPDLCVLRYITEAGDDNLEQWCLRTGQLPSRAFGQSSCADKWKIRPMEKWATHEPRLRAARAAGQKPVALLGYDAGEVRRNRMSENDRWSFRAPLIDWGWYRDDCVRAITAGGLPLPCKSACFFCPSSTKPEILALAEAHPELMMRALAIEDGAAAGLRTAKGLGRRFAWRDLFEDPAGHWPESPVEQCLMCADEGEAP